MSQTRNTFSPEEQIKYWKERIFDKTVSMSKQLALDMDGILSSLNHVKLDDVGVREAFSKLGESLLALGSAVKEARTQEEANKLREKAKAEKEAKVVKVETKAAIVEPIEEKKAEPVVAEAK